MLLVLVAGLLRSHAELLRRLGTRGARGASALGAGRARAQPRACAAPPGARSCGRHARRRRGGAGFRRRGGTLTLLAFLTTGCQTCAGFWESLAESRLPAEVQTVIVTHGGDRERVSRVAALAPADVAVIMSSQAWLDYEVPGAPYFVLAERSVLGEGVASTWPALASLVGDAIAEEREAAAVNVRPRAGRRAARAPARARRIDATLAAGGIGPDHPSLHPGGRA